MPSDLFRHETLSLNGQHLHVASSGSGDAPVAVMLHGFPEHWTAWADVARRLPELRCVLPDQRGCGTSSKPEGVLNYEPKQLAADALALIDHVSPDRPVILCGHDWGASVAYAVAFRAPQRVSHLVIANGVHPVPFQRSLLAKGAQRDASQYITTLRDPASNARMQAEGFRRTFGMFERFSAAPWLTDAKRAEYVESWTGALPTMIDWYRATPIRVPASDAPHENFPTTQRMRERFHVPMPHLLLWGEQDTALLAASREGLAEFAPNLAVRTFADASHWILHEQPDAVARSITEFTA